MRPALVLFVISLAVAACTGPGVEVPPRASLTEAPATSTAPGTPAGIAMHTLLDNLDQPWGMDFLPNGSLLVTELEGSLLRVDGSTFATTAIAGLPEVTATGQGGLMDVLVHPQFASNQTIYLSYTVAQDRKYSTRVSRARLVGDALVDVESLFTAQPFFSQRRHFGSRLLWDNGYLFITVGDRGNRDRAQDLDTHNGKVIRLHDDGRVPADNPFVDLADALPEIWTYGHRNPQGMAKHPVSGEIWVAEHGPRGGDEVNALAAGTNYGWPVITYGKEYSGGNIGVGTHADGMAQPLIYWVPSIGAAGMDFYSGDAYPGWSPSLLVAGLKLTRISRLKLTDSGLGAETRLLSDLKMRIRDVQVGPDGLIYALADGSRLIRLQPE
ncbi:MAG: PQQ-dependent sugar dehydrogenase [Halieaceae bacterium]|nr:PQQ-dependent sugar dehydrogenase [Halieaceae bacterium]